MTDTFTIKFSSDADGATRKLPFTLTETEINTTSTSLTLHGKNAVPFGEDLWNNLVHLLENFCSSSGPAYSTLGQLWFDTTANALKVRRLSSSVPGTLEWALISPFNGSSNLTIPLITSGVNNGIADDTSSFDNYFVTRGYTDGRYLRSGSTFDNTTTSKSKYIIEYGTGFTTAEFTGKNNALVTKQYVDTLIGIADNLSIDVLVDGSMVTTKPLIGSLDNMIPAAGAIPSGNLSTYDNYYITRGYADQRYLREGVFDNDNRRMSISKIQYNSDAIYSVSDDDDYTLVHKKYVVDYVTSSIAANATPIPSWLAGTQPAGLGVLWSNGTDPINIVPIGTNTGGQVLAINSSANGFEWITPAAPAPTLPAWISTIPTGVMVGNGSIVNGVSSTLDKQILSTKLTGSNVSYEWKSITDLDLVSKVTTENGFLYANGSAITYSKGGNDTVLTINSTGTPEWVAKSTLGGGTPTNIPTAFWTDVKSTRTANTTYTNTTGSAIIVIVVVGNTPDTRHDFLVGATIVGKTSTTAMQNVTFVVPAGVTYRYSNTSYNSSTNGEIYAWVESGGANITGGGSTMPILAKGVVISDGSTLSSKSYGTNNQLLASDGGNGLKWVDSSTIGGSSSTVNSNAIATTNPGPVTFTNTKASNTTMYDGYVLPSGYNMSVTTQLLSLKLPVLSSDTLVSVTTGGVTARTGTGAIVVLKLFADVNGTNVRSVSEDGTTFIISVKAGTSYTINLIGQFHTALGAFSGAGTVTASNVFIEALAVGGTLSSTGSSSSGAVRMQKNTVASTAFTNSNTPVNLVSVTIPASAAGTTVEYWVTLGFSHIDGYTINDGSVPDSTVITVKDGSAIKYTFDSIYTRFYSAAFSVSVSSTAKTLTLAIRGVNCSGSCINNYITATPITSL